jgi:hypothetical protein
LIAYAIPQHASSTSTTSTAATAAGIFRRIITERAKTTIKTLPCGANAGV